MDIGSLVQQYRLLVFSGTAEELPGVLNISDGPVIATSCTKIYYGVWESPDGQRIDVAVKKFKALTARSRHSDPQSLQWRMDTRIKREVTVWRGIVHRNLHPLLGYRLQPRPQLISPWCHHGNLTDYLRSNPGLSRLDKLRLIDQAASGLDHLHSLTPPVCHADIKPENVLINDRREAALSDFGLSRVLLDLGESSGLTTSETARGTLRYMAGELHMEGKRRPDRKTDVYAFGGLILTVMSGKPPFWGLRDSAILLRIIQNQTPNPEEHADLPPDDDLWNLMRRCWDSDPTARPTMREVLWEFRGHISREQSGQRLTPRLPPTAEAGGRGYSYMNLHTPTTVSQEGIPRRSSGNRENLLFRCRNHAVAGNRRFPLTDHVLPCR